jgi:hypothetical protein
MNPDNLWKTNDDIAKALDRKGWDVTDVATAWLMDADCVVDDEDDRYQDCTQEDEDYLYDDSHGSIAVMRECNAAEFIAELMPPTAALWRTDDAVHEVAAAHCLAQVATLLDDEDSM